MFLDRLFKSESHFGSTQSRRTALDFDGMRKFLIAFNAKIIYISFLAFVLK